MTPETRERLIDLGYIVSEGLRDYFHYTTVDGSERTGYMLTRGPDMPFNDNQDIVELYFTLIPPGSWEEGKTEAYRIQIDRIA